MISFAIIKKSKYSNARAGIINTPHGHIETPTFVPVATRAVVKTLTVQNLIATRSQVAIANTFHLHIRPGEKIIKKNGGINEFMGWPRPMMTDSGGYQVFSMGFGADFKTAKILRERQDAIIRRDAQPKNIKITNDGVFFAHP